MRKIIHLDLDCFYAAVEEKYNPNLKNKPVGIGGPSDSRGVLCTANYTARRFGVRAAMSTAQAKKLCPQLILMPPHFDLYKKESASVFSIYREFTEKIEPLSLDEAYLDVSHSENASLLAENIRARVAAETKLTVSAGVAPNKLLAKIASDWNKPNGSFVVKPSEVLNFVSKLPVSKLFGVGKVTKKNLAAHQILTCADLQKAQPQLLRRIFGSKWESYRDMAFGIDSREVITESSPKSLSIESTFDQDLKDFTAIDRELQILFPDWLERLKECKDKNPQMEIKSWFIKIKFSDFKISTRVNADSRIPTLDDFRNLLLNLWSEKPEPLRLIGFGLKLKPVEDGASHELPLFNSF